jgi:hypothetical protein
LQSSPPVISNQPTSTWGWKGSRQEKETLVELLSAKEEIVNVGLQANKENPPEDATTPKDKSTQQTVKDATDSNNKNNRPSFSRCAIQLLCHFQAKFTIVAGCCVLSLSSRCVVHRASCVVCVIACNCKQNCQEELLELKRHDFAPITCNLHG